MKNITGSRLIFMAMKELACTAPSADVHSLNVCMHQLSSYVVSMTYDPYRTASNTILTDSAPLGLRRRTPCISSGRKHVLHEMACKHVTKMRKARGKK